MIEPNIEALLEVIEQPDLRDWIDEYANVFPTGSNFICYPPVEDTDIDWTVWVEDKTEREEMIEGLIDGDGWVVCGPGDDSEFAYEGHVDGTFIALRKGKHNLIITKDLSFHKRFMVATSVARQLNLREKVQRVNLFSWLIHDSYMLDEKNFKDIQLDGSFELAVSDEDLSF